MSVFSDLKPRNHVSRNGFDLSRRTVFSNKSGQIIPMFIQPTLPNSTYKIDINQLMRTQPLQTASFSGASVNYDFVFVPLNQLYSSFNQFISQRVNKNMVNQPSNESVPTFSLYHFLMAVVPFAVYDFVTATLFSTERNYITAFQLYKGDNPSSSFTSTSYPPFISVRNPRDKSQSQFLGVIRMLDMFGYGNYLPMVVTCAKELMDSVPITEAGEWFEWLEGAYLPSASTFYEKFSNVRQKLRLAIGDVLDEMAPDLDVRPNLWPVLAYNKLFAEYYRNDYYDLAYPLDSFYSYTYTAGVMEFQYVQLFNFDDYTTAKGSANDSSVARLVAMFTPKYHLYKRDLFTGVLPDTQYGSVEVMTDGRDWLKMYMKDSDGSTFPLYGQQTSSSASVGNVQFRGKNVMDTGGQGFRFDPALSISVLESRRADAMQRFKERMMRAGNKTKDVFKAHGWENPKSEIVFEPTFLGSFDGRLDINVVAATSPSHDGNVELGQLAANGSCVTNGHQIKVSTSDFGLLIGVNYIVKDAEYDAYGLERHLQLTSAFDYPYPELQNISLSPVALGELCALGTGNEGTSFPFNHVLGYLPRFMEFKTSLDKVHGEFYSGNPLIQSFDSPGSHGNIPNSLRKGVFSDFVTPRQSLTDCLSVDFLYQSCSIFDAVFYEAANSLQSTDQFLFNCFIRCQAIEPISVIGLPI